MTRSRVIASRAVEAVKVQRGGSGHYVDIAELHQKWAAFTTELRSEMGQKERSEPPASSLKTPAVPEKSESPGPVPMSGVTFGSKPSTALQQFSMSSQSRGLRDLQELEAVILPHNCLAGHTCTNL